MSEATFHLRIVTAGGEVIEDTFNGEPIALRLGAGEVDAFIERLVHGAEIGALQDVRVCAADAFGVPEAGRCIEVPRSRFGTGLEPEPGTVMEFELNEEAVAGTIVSTDEHSVLVDLNHPLAGHDLDVRLQVISRSPPDGR